MHPALAGVALRALGRGRLVDHALLHDRAVHREAVRGRFLGVRGGGGGDEGFQDGILDLVRCCRGWSWVFGVEGEPRTMISEFQSPTLACSYSVLSFSAESQACYMVL